MTENIKAAALAANLKGEQKKQVDDLVKSLFVNRELNNLPKEVANKKFASLPADQQDDLKKRYGTEDPAIKPSRGFLSSAWHYATFPVVEPAKLVFKGLIETSDFMTRAYRTGAISVIEGKTLSEAWTKANDKGDKAYNDGRIENAKAKYGQIAVDLAMRIKSGEAPADIWATSTPEQQKYLMLDDKNNTVIPGVENIEEARGLWQDALDEVDRAKFSPGRQLANLLLPEALEKNKLIYSYTSGVADAAFRLGADPLVIGSKVRSLYVIGKYSLDVIGASSVKVNSLFSQKNVINFWDQYGAGLDKLTKAQKSGRQLDAVAARRELEIMAPEFGPEVIRVFQQSDIINANTARGFFLNTEEAVTVLKGSIGRKRVILPRLDAGRKARIAIVTEADKLISLDRYGSGMVDDFYGNPPTSDGVLKSLSENGKAIGVAINETKNFKNWIRYPSATIALRIDKAKAKFNIAPLFKNDQFDVNAADASTMVYRFARIVMTKQDAKLIAETFESVGDIGKRKEMVKGLWETIAEARGLNLNESGQKISRVMAGKGDERFAVSNLGDDFADIGAIPSDYNSLMTMPSLVDIDRAASRSGLIGRMLNGANKQWVDNMTGYWSFLTLAGPRYAIRNAGEDLMVHLAIGGSPWGLAKSRYLSTRVNTALEGARTAGTWNDNSLGLVMRILNKNEAVKYEAQLANLDKTIKEAKEQIALKAQAIKATSDPAVKATLQSEIAALRTSTAGGAIKQTRLIMANALTSGRINRARKAMGLKPMFEEEAEILAEHLVYGNLDNAMSIVSEGASNFATGGDMITRATLFTRSHGVRSEALVINDPRVKKLARAKGDDAGYAPIALGNLDDASMITWLMRINYYANDELGAIAIANLDDKDVAITKILEWMKNNPSFRAEAQLAARNIDEAQQAEIIFRRSKEIFEKRGKIAGVEKEVNLDLLNKIRTLDDEGNWVISGKLSLDDLPQVADDMPEYVLGPKLVPISDSGNPAASTVSKGWTWLGMANARMSREPIVFERIIQMRKQMKSTGLEDAYIASVVSKISPSTTKTSKIPEGLKFDYLNADNSLETKLLLRNQYNINKQQSNQALNAHTIIAKDKNGNYVGHISWNKDTGKIQLVSVSPEMQRKGVATELFNQAKEVKGNVVKPIQETVAANLSPEGIAWQKSIKSGKTKITDETYAKKVAQATERAKYNFAQIIEERAVAQTLAYVDNPLVRTQIAFSIRNFSRFYRATEDFYRRIYRTVRYNPMAIRKAALTFDGLSHNGWIQEDDQGEKYFVYPGLEPIYRAVQSTMALMGVAPDFKTPFPVQFGAQVKMLTPSLNQDSIVPTFNGPLAGISIKTISNLVDVFGAPGAADTITELSLGKYAVGRSYLSSFLPAHINRIYETMDKDERDSQYASAWRKAVTYLEASGNGLPKNYDELGNIIPPTIQEQEEYRQRVKNTVLGVLGTRFISGFLLPASPSVQLRSDDMAAWIKDNGQANFKQAWNSLSSKYPGDYDSAMAKWVELFPNEIPFTISESEKKTVAVVKYAEESGAFVDQNQGLFEQYPQGAAFLIPHKSGFSWDAYKTMKDMGLKYNKRVDDYLLEVQTAADLQTYFSKKNEYEDSLKNKITDFERTLARKEFTEWSTTFKAGRPLVQQELAQGGKRAIERMNAIDDLRNMLNDKSVTVRGPVQKVLKDMLDIYDTYKLQKEALGNLSGSTNLISFMKDNSIVRLRELAKTNENTMSAYNTLFASLIGDTDG